MICKWKEKWLRYEIKINKYIANEKSNLKTDIPLNTILIVDDNDGVCWS